MDALPEGPARPVLPELRAVDAEPGGPAPVPQPDPLRHYLAAHDEPCPECGYNLRGVEEPRCPECGHAIRLAVQGAKAGTGYLWFLLLAFGWVFLASGMNAARCGRQAYQEARGPFVVLSGGSIRFQTTPSGAVITYGSGGGTTLFGTTPSSPPLILPAPAPRPGGPGAAEKALVERQLRLQATQQMRQAQNMALQMQAQSLRTFAAGPAVAGGGGNLTLNLSSVRPTTWVSLGWWTTLGLASLVSLVVVAVVWPRRRAAAPRPLLVLACTLFVLYAGYHTLMFAREIAA